MTEPAASTGPPRRPRARAAVLLLVGFVVGLFGPRIVGRSRPAAEKTAEVAEPPADDGARYEEAEELVYRQGDLLADELDRLKPQRRGIADLYFVGFAGDAEQDVFMREVAYARGLFDRRFDTAGRSMVLINNRSTKDRFPLASLASLEIAVGRIGEILDSDEDVLVLLLTSHGSEDHVLSVAYDPMPFLGIAPEDLAKVLEASSIRWRVVVVSACYSGAFLDALKNDHTLVITASAADRQSFGCGQGDDLTYFGHAFLQEGLEKTFSFLDAFGAAGAAIARREHREKLTASQPQIHAPTPILEKLRAVEVRLAAREKRGRTR